MTVYLIRAGEAGPVKIGVADDPERRLAELQTGNPEELRVLRILDGGLIEEGVLHRRFADLKIRGEWFRFHPDMMAVELTPHSLSVEQPSSLGFPNGYGVPTAALIERRAEAAGMRISEVCRKAGIAVSTFWRWKTGKTSLRVTFAARLLEVTAPTSEEAV